MVAAFAARTGRVRGRVRLSASPAASPRSRSGTSRRSVGAADRSTGDGAATASSPASTHDSTAVQPGDLYAALAGGRRGTAPSSPRRRRERGRGRRPDRRGRCRRALSGRRPAGPRRRRPARAVLGAVAVGRLRRPDRAAAVIGITGTAGKTSTAYLIESGLRAAGHTTCMIGTVETRIAGLTSTASRTTPEATDLHALLRRRRCERGATRGGDGGLQPRAGLRPGRRGPVRRRRLHQLRPRPPRLPRRCRRLLRGEGEALRRTVPGRGAQLRRPRGTAAGPRPGRVTFSAAGRARRRPGAPREVTPDGLRAALHRRRSGRPRGAGAGWRCPGGTTSPTRCSRSPAWSRSGSTRPPRRPASPPAAACPAGWSWSTRRARCSASSTTRTSPTRSWPPWPRARAEPATAAAGCICVIGAGGDRDRGKRPFMGEAAAQRRRPRRGHRRQPARGGSGRDPGRGAGRAPRRGGRAGRDSVIEVRRPSGGDRRGGAAGRTGRRRRGAGQGARARPGDRPATVSPFDDRVELAAALARPVRRR